MNAALGGRLKVWLWKLLWPIRADQQKGLQKGETFPDFALDDFNGRRHCLSEDRAGRFTVLWFTNLCEDCQSKVPLLEELRLAAGDDFRVLAVSLLGDDPTLPRQVSARCGFPILMDPEDIVANKLGLSHPPQTCPLHNLFILDLDGRIVFRHHLSALKPEAFRSLWHGFSNRPRDL